MKLASKRLRGPDWEGVWFFVCDKRGISPSLSANPRDVEGW